MDKYLLDILKEVNMIIIPGLGALSLTNRDTGEIMFMPYLKHDDGNLSKFIAEKEGWEENDAKNLVAKYVRDIEAKLNVGESYDMFQFGSFSKDKSGDIQFTSWKAPVTEEVVEITEEVEVGETPIANILPVEDQKEEKEESVFVEETVVAEILDEPEIEIEETPSEIIIEEESYGMPEAIEEPLVAETIPAQEEKETIQETIVENNIEYSEAQQWEDDLDIPPISAKAERPKKPVLEKAKKDRKKRSPLFYAMLVLIVLLVGGGTTLGLFYNQIKSIIVSSNVSEDATILAEKQFEFSEEAKPDEEPEAQEDITEAVPEEIQVEKEEVKEVVKTNPTPAPQDFGKSYQIITGSFQNKDFAERFNSRMESEGNQSAVLGPINSVYLISIGSYATENEAKEALKAKKAAYPKAWVLKMN